MGGKEKRENRGTPGGRSRSGGAPLSRRKFLASAALAGAGVVVTHVPLRRKRVPVTSAVSDINVGLIGAGSQGRILMQLCLKIPGIRFLAVTDVWPYHQQYAANILKRFDQEVSVYADYREMLAKEKGLDAVIVATPDWKHSEQAIACMRAGRHVYCEKEMASTIEDAREMVLASRSTRRLLQIGHQRRSNPRYWHVHNLIRKEGLLGQVTHTFGQWNRAQLLEQGWPSRHVLSEDDLKRHGYDTMFRLRNWRWFRKFSGGPIADLGSHQIDIFNWFLQANPAAVMASGGSDYYKKSEWYDNIMAIYEYRTKEGPVRGFYQVLNTTSHGGYTEAFMGMSGSVVISEDPRVGFFFREPHAQTRSWEDEAEKVKAMERDAIELKIGETRRAGKVDKKTLKLEAAAQKPAHQPHLENFFDAIRGKAKLTCPAEAAFDTAVTILRTNEAVAAQRRITYAPEEFKA